MVRFDELEPTRRLPAPSSEATVLCASAAATRCAGSPTAATSSTAAVWTAGWSTTSGLPSLPRAAHPGRDGRRALGCRRRPARRLRPGLLLLGRAAPVHAHPDAAAGAPAAAQRPLRLPAPKQAPQRSVARRGDVQDARAQSRRPQQGPPCASAAVASPCSVRSHEYSLPDGRRVPSAHPWQLRDPPSILLF